MTIRAENQGVEEKSSYRLGESFLNLSSRKDKTSERDNLLRKPIV